MSKQIVTPRIRGFLCTTAHPAGCRASVEQQVAIARREPAARPGGNLLVIGASTGYGLATRITGAFRYGMDSLGLFYERPPKGDRTASAGWYNTVAFTELARDEGLKALNINGDAFSEEILEEATETIRNDLGPIDVLVYSIAAPMRTDPVTGETYRSVLKPIGEALEIKSLDVDSGTVVNAEIEPATEEEIEATVKVMGGEDLQRWVDRLMREGLLANEARVVAYSYIGPDITWPIYHKGTIGRAKAHLQHTCDRIQERLHRQISGTCHLSVNKSVVTQAAAAIPAVPLYISTAYEVMRQQGVHEDPIHQMVRLFDDHLMIDGDPPVDSERRIRLDDIEMRDDIQTLIRARWNRLSDENLEKLAGFERYQVEFRQLFGFDVPGVDYEAPVETDVPLP